MDTEHLLQGSTKSYYKAWAVTLNKKKKKMYLVAIGRDKPEIPHLLILSPNDDKTRSEELHMGFPNRWQEPKHLGHLHRHISSELNWKWSIQYLNQCLCGMVCRCHIQPLHLLCYNTSPKLLLLLLFFFFTRVLHSGKQSSLYYKNKLSTKHHVYSHSIIFT